MPKRPNRYQIQTEKFKRDAKNEDNVKRKHSKLDYPIGTVNAIARDRNNLADILRNKRKK